jgi:hypothetical protein
MKRLIHYSNKPVLEVRSIDQRPQTKGVPRKPRGLWVSTEGEDGWAEWCKAENFQLDCLEYQTEVLLKPQANILTLEGKEAIVAFTNEFGVPAPEYLRGLSSFFDSYGNGYGIDWQKVAKKYQGIIIAPYCWELRLEDTTWWYYGWDCASGCIWNADAVAELKVLELTKE